MWDSHLGYLNDKPSRLSQGQAGCLLHNCFSLYCLSLGKIMELFVKTVVLFA